MLISLPDFQLLSAIEDLPHGVEFVEWDLRGPAPMDRADIVVVPYMRPPQMLEHLAGLPVRLVQSQMLGYDGVAAHLPPGMVFANAVSVHEASAAELAVALMLAAQRGIPDFVRAAQEGRWAYQQYPSLADKRVLLIGYGGLGQAIEARLAGFETEIVRVARRAREVDGRRIHGIDELPELLPTADIVVLAVRSDESTARLADAEFLRAIPDGGLLVNVARGPVVDTAALVAETVPGRLRAALDVTDPEPLPADHVLYTLPNVLVSPHVGGNTSAMIPRMARLLRRQMALLAAGEEPINVVLRT